MGAEFRGENKLKYVVTGGGGFVGKKLCLLLAGDGHEVCSVSRKRYPELEEKGIRCCQADLASATDAYDWAFAGAEAVFHVAAKVDMWGRYEDFFRANVLATRNVISLCRERGVRKLIYTSSPSVVADGTDLKGVDESYPYPRHFSAFYPQTKAMAEQEVLRANSSFLWTVALRPHLIWGPGDTNLVPTVLARARAGKLVRIGKGENKVDISYIEDCAAAHLCALNALEQNPQCRARAYFISQGEAVNLWDWLNEILLRHNLAPVSRSIPKGPALCLAGVMELWAQLMPGSKPPLLTRFLVSEMATSHYFNISAARQELGYAPRFSVAEAMKIAFA